MATSGTYNFNPALGETVIYAFNLAGVRATALVQEHFESARMAVNMLMGRWSSMPGVNTWTVDLQTTTLIAGQATYTVLPNTIAIMDAYVTVTSGGIVTNRILTPISRSEYASYSEPSQQGFPSVYWFDRLLSPTITLYQVPNGQQVSLSYYRMRQIQDANLTNAQQVEIPYYWLEAFAFALAHRLAIIWNPDKAQGLKTLADESYQIAADQNVETSNFYISPSISGYFQA